MVNKNWIIFTELFDNIVDFDPCRIPRIYILFEVRLELNSFPKFFVYYWITIIVVNNLHETYDLDFGKSWFDVTNIIILKRYYDIKSFHQYR